MIQKITSYKMKDLVNLSGVSKQTIHFYLREGLLLPPVHTSKNMSYYDESTIDDIRFIKELQGKRYLPLIRIKEILEAKRDGNNLIEEDHLALHEHLFNQASEGIASRQFDKISFLAETGLTEHELNQLIHMRIISPSLVIGDLQFNEFDIAITEALKGLMAMGIRMQDIKLYDNFLQFTRLEVELVHDRIIHQDYEEKHRPFRDIYSKLERVKSLLTAKSYREYFINHSHEKKAMQGTSK